MKKSQDRKRLNSSTPPRPADIDRIPAPTHQTKRAKVGNKAALLALLLIAVGIIRLLTWSIQSSQPLVINNSPFPTRSVGSAAEANGVIILAVDFCKNTSKQGEVRTSFVSASREIFLPLATEQFTEGCRKEELPVLVPKDLPADDYQLRFTARYNLNPLKKDVHVVFESQTFHVNPLAGGEELLEEPQN